jgi:hypothetical protein
MSRSEKIIAPETIESYRSEATNPNQSPIAKPVNSGGSKTISGDTSKSVSKIIGKKSKRKRIKVRLYCY